MSRFNPTARVTWVQGASNPFPPGTGPWQRTEIVRKAVGRKALTVAQIEKLKIKPSTLDTLFGGRCIGIEGYTWATSAEDMEERKSTLYAIVREQYPMTVRQVFYQASVRGLVEKAETGYNKVQTLLARMRREAELPFSWIVDNTRRENRPYTSTSIAEALKDTAETYRRTLWTDKDPLVQIWLEKDALSGVISPVTRKYDVGLFPARGYSGITFLHDAAMQLPRDRKSFVYHLGDFDPSGVDAAEKIEEDLRGWAPAGADMRFQRIAVTEEQIEEWDLPSRPTKTSDSRYERFGSDESVELDAIDPRELRKLVKRVINRHVPEKKYNALVRQQEQEKARIQEFVDQIIEEEGLEEDEPEDDTDTDTDDEPDDTDDE
jgi:hypothetical protein